MLLSSTYVWLFLAIHILLLDKQLDSVQGSQDVTRNKGNAYLDFYHFHCKRKRGLQLPYCRMNSETQADSVNTFADNEEEVVSKYFPKTHEKDSQGVDSLIPDREDKMEEETVDVTENNMENIEVVEDARSPDKSSEPLENRFEKEEQVVEAEDMITEKVTTNSEFRKSERLDAEVKNDEEDETQCEKKLDNEYEAETVEDVDASRGPEYTDADFHSGASGSDKERDLDEDIADKFSKAAKHAGRKDGKKKKNKKKHDKFKLVKRYSDKDTEKYRNGYPGQEDDLDLNDNLRFYRNEIPSSPNGALIDDIHEKWWGDYELLERHHGYIQWLFPIRESGLNWQAQPLQLHEAEEIKSDPVAKKRVLTSYKMMLDFYGMELVDEKTGKLKRSTNWKKCYNNLNWSSHNYLRITRILKCLGELGYEHLKKMFIQFVLKEAFEERTLVNTLTSCRDYWIGTIKNDNDRQELYKYFEDYDEENQ